MSTKQYKNIKGLKKENLRDNMTTLELVLNMLAEATTTEISKQRQPATFKENMEIAREGGEAAGDARRAVESRTGVPVITSKNAAQLNQVVAKMIEDMASEPDDFQKKKE
jgi:predicted transcriptional regulator